MRKGTKTTANGGLERPRDIIKICRCCNILAPHFWRNCKTHKHGGFYSSYCRKCHNRKRREQLQRNQPEKLVGFFSQLVKLTHSELKKRAVEHLGGRCSFCGLMDDCLDVYDFHHPESNKKEAEISRICTWRKMKKELDNCVLLCAVCHRREHGKSACCKREKGAAG